MNPIKHLPAVLCLAAFLTSCKVVPQEVLLPKEVLIAREEARIQTGKAPMLMPLLSMGGQAEYSRESPEEVIRLKWNDEKSFRDGMVAGGVIGASVANAVATKASEETAQAAIAADAKAKAAASDAALKQALAAEQTKQLGMELDAGAAAVIPTP